MWKKISFCRAVILAAIFTATSTGVNAAPGCTFNDLSGVTVTACSGFYDGNLLGGSSTAQVQSIINGLSSQLGQNFTYLGGWLEKIDDTGGSSTITFASLLTGPTIVGIHFGGGAKYVGTSTKIFAPGTGGGTAFYLFDAGNAGIHSFGLNLTASSGAAVISAIPEPEIYAMMAAGLGIIGFMARRKKNAA